MIFWVGAPRGPNEIIGLIEDVRLPFQAQEALIGKKVRQREIADYGLGSCLLIGIGFYAIVHNWNAK